MATTRFWNGGGGCRSFAKFKYFNALEGGWLNHLRREQATVHLPVVLLLDTQEELVREMDRVEAITSL